MSLVSVFESVSKVTNPHDIDIFDLFEVIKSSKYEDACNLIRLQKDKTLKGELKRKLPTVTLSGKFKYRNNEGLINHSGFINIDLDHLENYSELWERLKLDPYVFALWMSTGGDGMRVLIRIDGKRHADAFRGLSKYFKETYGVIVDPSSISVSTPFLMSYDPNLFHKKGIEWTGYVKEVEIKRIQNFVHTASDFDEVMRQIEARRLSICESYNEWFKTGQALAEQFGEAGRDYYHRISFLTSHYNKVECDKQYTYCVRRRGRNGVAISTFYYYAKLSGCNIVTERTKTIVRVTLLNKRSGLSKEQVIENLAKFNDITDGQEVVDQIWDSQDANLDNDQPDILTELEIFLTNNYSLKMNLVTNYIENNGKRVKENDLNTIFVAAKKVIPKLDFPLMKRLLFSDFVPTFNPFFDFLNSDGVPVYPPAIWKDDKRKWDSPLITQLASCIKNDDSMFTEHFLRKWIVGIISAMHGVHSVLMLDLLGPQGTGKTEFLRRLLPKELKHYFAESKFEREKDDEILMTEKILIMDDELGGKTKTDVLKLKNISSKEYIYTRRPYGTSNEDILRYAVLCGTGNELGVLADVFNRRVIPIRVDRMIDIELYNSIDKKELFYEAFRLYKEGFDWTVRGDDIKYLATNESDFEMPVLERELIAKFYSADAVPGVPSTLLSSGEIKVELEMLTKQKLSLNIIGRELSKAMYKKKSVRVGVTTLHKWIVTKINREGYQSSSDIPF